MIESQAKAGSRALSGIIGKTRENYDLGYKSYTQLINSMVIPILDYGGSAWSGGNHHNFKKADQVLQRATRFYCGLPRHATLLGLEGDMG